MRGVVQWQGKKKWTTGFDRFPVLESLYKISMFMIVKLDIESLNTIQNKSLAIVVALTYRILLFVMFIYLNLELNYSSIRVSSYLYLLAEERGVFIENQVISYFAAGKKLSRSVLIRSFLFPPILFESLSGNF